MPAPAVFRFLKAPGAGLCKHCHNPLTDDNQIWLKIKNQRKRYYICKTCKAVAFRDVGRANGRRAVDRPYKPAEGCVVGTGLCKDCHNLLNESNRLRVYGSDTRYNRRCRFCWNRRLVDAGKRKQMSRTLYPFRERKKEKQLNRIDFGDKYRIRNLVFLSDGHIKSMFKGYGLDHNIVPEEFIDIKRIHLQLNRKIAKWHEQKNTPSTLTVSASV
jgi:RNase P subunit RPR2